MGNKVKRTALAAVVGSAAFLGGCLGGGGLFYSFINQAAAYVALELATDNDELFDLFEDGEPTLAPDEG